MDILDLIKRTDRAKPVAELPTGPELRRLRNNAGVSATQFAAAARVNLTTLTKFELGKTERPRDLVATSYRKVLAAIGEKR